VLGRLTAALASAILLIATENAAPAAGQVRLSVGEPQLGNVFDPSEPIHVPVNADADHILWSLADFDGVEIASGTTAVSSGRGTVVIAPPGPGYFDLVLRAPVAKGTQQAQTSLVVVPAPEGGAVSSSRFGVMTHFAQGWDTDVVPLIARAGIEHVRDEQYWNQIEPERSRYCFPDRLTRYMAELAQYRLEPLIVLSFANPLYDNGLTPFTPEGRDGYARYGKTVLDHYGSQIPAIEIWNEYNGSFCNGPCQDDRATYYVKMLEQSYRALKSSHPDVTVVGAATANIPLPYLEAVFQKGGLDFMDALSVHPYGSTPESVGKEIRDLRALAARYRHPELPIWVTEFGRGGQSAEGRREVARYLVRMGTALLAASVDRMYWYLLRDYREFEGMGLLHGADSDLGRYAPTPAYAAYANLIQLLGHARFVLREGANPRTPVYLFARDNQEVRVAWASDLPAKLRLEADDSLTVLDVVGRQIMTIDKRSAGTLVLDSTPVYILGNVKRITTIESGELLADSVEDYSDQQGKAGWSYGYSEEMRADRSHSPAAYALGDFKLMVPVADRWYHKWGEPRYSWLTIGPREAHPSRSQRGPIWAIRRWTSPVTGPVRISGHISHSASKGDGVSAHIAVDGRFIFSADLGGATGTHEVQYETKARLQMGSQVDFIVTPGPHDDINFDSTMVEARIVRDAP
jgi:hypothetical protein